MTYELAKQLKDAGFPQREEVGEGRWPHYTGYGLGYCDEHGVYYPTLSELIEACGNGFDVLKKGGEMWICGNDKYCCSEHGSYIEVISEGKTPEEAVARLWLALNAK
jgi:hypothetical protein